jgi:hypothetical protein
MLVSINLLSGRAKLCFANGPFIAELVYGRSSKEGDVYKFSRLLLSPALRVGVSPLLVSAATIAAFGVPRPAEALIITPIFETSWTSNAPSGATTVVNNVISEFESLFSNTVTVNVEFGWGDINGSALPNNALGVANFPSQNPQYSFSQTKTLFQNASLAQPNNTALSTAVANLPSSYPNPGGATSFFIPDPEYLALTGVAQNADPIESFTGYGTLVGTGFGWDFSGGTPSANNFDFTAVAEHEVAHALGRVDWAFQGGQGGAPPKLSPLDFYKYDCGTPTLDPKFNATCFSINGGATDLQKFSDQSDSGDWFGPSGTGGDSFDAFLAAGNKAVMSTADITEMCALGWQGCAAVSAVPEPGTLAFLSTSLLGFLALRRRR